MLLYLTLANAPLPAVQLGVSERRAYQLSLFATTLSTAGQNLTLSLPLALLDYTQLVQWGPASDQLIGNCTFTGPTVDCALFPAHASASTVPFRWRCHRACSRMIRFYPQNLLTLIFPCFLLAIPRGVFFSLSYKPPRIYGPSLSCSTFQGT